jgi:hypothetical protein
VLYILSPLLVGAVQVMARNPYWLGWLIQPFPVQARFRFFHRGGAQSTYGVPWQVTRPEVTDRATAVRGEGLS